MCVGSISQLQGVLLKFADHYKFCSCTVAFEGFVFSLKEDPHQKKILCLPLFPLKQIMCFHHNFPLEELLRAVVGEVPVSSLGTFLLQAGAVLLNRAATRGGWPRESSSRDTALGWQS